MTVAVLGILAGIALFRTYLRKRKRLEALAEECTKPELHVESLGRQDMATETSAIEIYEMTTGGQPAKIQGDGEPKRIHGDHEPAGM